MKYYTAPEVAKLLHKSNSRIRKMLQQDRNPKREKTHFPHAKKCEAGICTLIPETDLKTGDK